MAVRAASTSRALLSCASAWAACCFWLRSSWHASLWPLAAALTSASLCPARVCQRWVVLSSEQQGTQRQATLPRLCCQLLIALLCSPAALLQQGLDHALPAALQSPLHQGWQHG